MKIQNPKTLETGLEAFNAAWASLGSMYRDGPISTPEAMARVFFMAGYTKGIDKMISRWTLRLAAMATRQKP